MDSYVCMYGGSKQSNNSQKVLDKCEKMLKIEPVPGTLISDKIFKVSVNMGHSISIVFLYSFFFL